MLSPLPPNYEEILTALTIGAMWSTYGSFRFEKEFGTWQLITIVRSPLVPILFKLGSKTNYSYHVAYSIIKQNAIMLGHEAVIIVNEEVQLNAHAAVLGNINDVVWKFPVLLYF